MVDKLNQPFKKSKRTFKLKSSKNSVSRGKNTKYSTRSKRIRKNVNIKYNFKSKKKANRTYSTETKPNQLNPAFKKLLQILIKIVAVLSFPFVYIFKAISKAIIDFTLHKNNAVKVAFGLIFLAIVIRFGLLQILTDSSPFGAGPKLNINSTANLIRSRRGQVFIQDSIQNKDNIAVTTTQIETHIFFDPSNLKSLVDKGMDLIEVSAEMASRLNLPADEIYNNLFSSIQPQNPLKYKILFKDIDNQTKLNVDYLRTSKLNKKYSFLVWLNTTEEQSRSYPEGNLLASTIGYVPDYLARSSDISRLHSTCNNMVLDNKSRGTNTPDYHVGIYGLEQKFCSELGGLNGSGIANDNKVDVQNGADIYLTIDKSLQRKAEDILSQAVRDNTNSIGGPANGTITIVEAKTGKIKALASYPSYDPNSYQEYWQPGNPNYNPSAFRNAATNID